MAAQQENVTIAQEKEVEAATGPGSQEKAETPLQNPEIAKPEVPSVDQPDEEEHQVVLDAEDDDKEGRFQCSIVTLS